MQNVGTLPKPKPFTIKEVHITMNGKEFYIYFKDTLNRLGVGWHEMEKVQVKGKITLSYTENNFNKTNIVLDLKVKVK